MAVRFDEVVAEIRSLTPDEQLRLRDMLDEWYQDRVASMSEQEKQDELDRRLMARGLLRRVPSPVTGYAPYRNWQPIKVEGEPLSQTVIRDRE